MSLIDYFTRKNKRSALRSAFDETFKHFKYFEKIIYITLGHKELYDINDLLNVYNYEQFSKYISYDNDLNIVIESKKSLIYKYINNWHFEKKLECYYGNYCFNLNKLLRFHKSNKKIYFFDATGWFLEDDMNLVYNLLYNNLINYDDFFIVTATVGDLGWSPINTDTQTKVQKRLKRSKLLLDINSLSKNDLKSIHVELFLDQSSKKLYNHTRINKRFKLIKKIEYKDKNHLPMGLWVFQLNNKAQDLSSDIKVGYHEIFKNNIEISVDLENYLKLLELYREIKIRPSDIVIKKLDLSEDINKPLENIISDLQTNEDQIFLKGL